MSFLCWLKSFGELPQARTCSWWDFCAQELCPKGGTNICLVLGARRWEGRGRNSPFSLHTTGGKGCSAQEQKLFLNIFNISWNASKSLWRHQHSLARVITSSNLSFEALKSRPVSSQDIGRQKIWLHLGILIRVRMAVVLRKDQTKVRMCHSFANFSTDFSQELPWHRLVRPALLLGHSWGCPNPVYVMLLWK